MPIIPASALARRIEVGLQNELSYILASEVITEVEKRCANGMQYTTFPNKISDAEKQKLVDAGYKIIENTVQSKYRDGASDLYIGFQVALNATAASGNRSMVISESETNGISGGTGGTGNYEDLTNKPSIEGVTLSGNMSLGDLGVNPYTDAQVDDLGAMIS